MMLALTSAATSFAVSAPRAPTMAIDVRMQVAAPAPEKVKDALKTITLKNVAGDTATVYQFGACVTSYVKGGTDVLAVRPDAKLDGSKPISGGIPHCFPQFGPGAIQQHGFARNLDWEIIEQTDTTVVLGLSETDYTMDMWPHKFRAQYALELTDDALKTEFCVTNTGDKPFDFTAALHTYWSCSSIDNIKIKSAAFNGATYLDKIQSPPADVESKTDTIAINKEVDSVYAGVSGDVVLADSKRKRPLTIANKLGWSDTVIWSPYGDEGMGYDGFVCVESAQAASSVSLGPMEYWVGAMDVVP